MKNYKNEAFTMAEAIIIMTILGIIATILITNLKPAEFRDKGLEVLAKKIINQIDQATEQILLNNSYDGTMKTLYVPGTTNMYEFGSNYKYTLELYKKYLVTTRQPYNSTTAPQTIKNVVSNSTSANSVAPPLYLKDGTIVYLGTGAGYSLSLASAQQPVIAMAAAKIDYDINNEKLAAGSLMCPTMTAEKCNSSRCDDSYCCTEQGFDCSQPLGGGSGGGGGSSGSTITIDGCAMSKNLAGIITIDINGEAEPNIMYKDQFHIPIGLKGIDYEQFCRTSSDV